jgi:AmiR/NasT family two-component response regulator
MNCDEVCDELRAKLAEKEAELAAARGKIDKAKSILSMGHTQRERDAWEALKEAE